MFIGYKGAAHGEKGAEFGKLGGRPRKDNGKNQPPLRQKFGYRKK